MSDADNAVSKSILAALSGEQFDAVGKLSAKAVGCFIKEYGRLPTKTELRRIVTLVTRFVLQPDAPSYELN